MQTSKKQIILRIGRTILHATTSRSRLRSRFSHLKLFTDCFMLCLSDTLLLKSSESSSLSYSSTANQPASLLSASLMSIWRLSMSLIVRLVALFAESVSCVWRSSIMDLTSSRSSALKRNCLRFHFFFSSEAWPFLRSFFVSERDLLDSVLLADAVETSCNLESNL